MPLRRTRLAATVLAGVLMSCSQLAAAQELTKIRYFAAEKLDVSIDQGEGSAATVPRVMSGAYDAGFGDVDAVMGSPPGAAALRLFTALAKKSWLDPARVEILNMATNLQEQILLQGQVDVSAVI